MQMSANPSCDETAITLVDAGQIQQQLGIPFAAFGGGVKAEVDISSLDSNANLTGRPMQGVRRK